MNTSRPKNGSISSNKVVWFMITALLGVSMWFAGRLATNIRYELNTTTATAAENKTTNAKQDVEIKGVHSYLKRIEKNQDKMSDTLETILTRTFPRR